MATGVDEVIPVEPPGGLPPVDREFHVMRGDFYLRGSKKGLRGSDVGRMLDERPDGVLYNSSAGALSGERALRIGETARINCGVAGPKLTGSFHVAEFQYRVQCRRLPVLAYQGEALARRGARLPSRLSSNACWLLTPDALSPEVERDAGVVGVAAGLPEAEGLRLTVRPAVRAL